MQEGEDLFGQVAVTWPEVVDWVARVAGITPDSPRWMAYVKGWRVVEKIAAAKAWQEFEDANVKARSGAEAAHPPGRR